MIIAAVAAAQDKSETDTIKTSTGDLKITFIGHGSKAPIIKECILHFECRVVYKNDLIPSELEK